MNVARCRSPEESLAEQGLQSVSVSEPLLLQARWNQSKH